MVISHNLRMLTELKNILKDEGVLLFFFFLPIVYPLLYSWIYNNETVRDVPIALVDNSHSPTSREFWQKCDATPDVCIAYHCTDMEEAKKLIGMEKAYGIIYIPTDFEKKIGRHEQAHVSVYCDMSYMLAYKAIAATTTAVSMDMGTEIQRSLMSNKTQREDEIASRPLDFDEVSIFNAPGGYGNFMLPVVLILIIQQSILLGVGMIAGTEREKRFANYRRTTGYSRLWQAVRILCGKSWAYILIFAVMLAWVTLAIPHIFGFVSLVHGKDLLLFLAPYLLACVLFAITFSEMVRYRESVMLAVVFTSVIFLFLSGLSWPQAETPGVWQGIANILPSTFGIRGFVRMSSMGALLPDVAKEWRALWLLVACYGITALLVIWWRVHISEKEKEEHNIIK